MYYILQLGEEKEIEVSPYWFDSIDIGERFMPKGKRNQWYEVTQIQELGDTTYIKAEKVDMSLEDLL